MPDSSISASCEVRASVWLAVAVVSWHNFNLSGLAAADFQACLRKRWDRRRQVLGSTFRAGRSRLRRIAITVPCQRCEMRNPTSIAELDRKLGTPSDETVESLRLLKAFFKLAPVQRFEVIELVERLACDGSGDRPLS